MDGHAVRVLGGLTERLGHGRVRVDRVRQIADVQVRGDGERALVDQFAGLRAEDVRAQHLVRRRVPDDLDEARGLAVRDIAAVRAEREAPDLDLTPLGARLARSEERRVGKGCGTRWSWSPYNLALVESRAK